MFQKVVVSVVSAILLISSFSLEALSLDEAKALANDGDLPAALDAHLELIAQNPADLMTLESAADIAAQMQIPEMAADFLIQGVDQAVAEGDRDTAKRLNETISGLYSQTPEWIEQKQLAAERIEDQQADVAFAIDEMIAEAEQLFALGDTDGALAAQDSAFLMASDVLGPTHYLAIDAQLDLGVMYRNLGSAEEAELYYTGALVASEASLGANHPKTLTIKSYLAELYAALGAVEVTIQLMDEVYASYSDALGSFHPDSLGAKYDLILYLQRGTNYEAARLVTDQTCELIEVGYGAYHRASISCLVASADLDKARGELRAAVQSYADVGQRVGQSTDEIDDVVLRSLLETADLKRVLGEYPEAEELLSAVSQIAFLTGFDQESASAKGYQGRLYRDIGDYDKALLFTQQFLDFGLENWRDAPQNIYATLMELGAIYQAQGNLADAEATYLEAVEGWASVKGKYDVSTLIAQGNLGQVYELSGLFDLAEPLLKDTLSQMEQALGEAEPNTLGIRNNLALLFESQGNFREAEPLYIKSYDLMVQLFGEDHNAPISVRNNLAYLYMLMEDYERSSSMFEDVIRRWEGVLGPTHQNTLKAKNNLGRVYKRQGSLDLAEANISSALDLRREVLGADHLDSIRSMIDLGGVYIDQGRNEEAVNLLTEALSLAETRLGNLHPYTFDALNYLATVNENMNELKSAIEIREVGFARRSDFLDTMLWTTGENAREGYIRLYRPEFDAYLSLLSRVGDSSAAQKLIDASLQRKGLLLKVTSEIQQIATMTTDPQLAALANELEQARVDLASMTLSGPTAETGDNHVEILYQLEQRVNEIQGELGRASVRFRTSIAGTSSERLAEEMADESALVDFMMYEADGEPAMLAGVITKTGGEVDFHIVNYEDREAMEAAVSFYREMIQDDLADEDELIEVGIETYLEVWEPLMDPLGDLDYVYLIPDGLLNIVPFGALMNEDEQYLIQTHDLHLLTSGRDLLPNEFQLAVGEYLVMAGPDYDSEEVVSAEVIEAAEGRRSAALQMGIRGAGGGLRGLNFAPLPGAEEEGKIIIEQVVSNDGTSENFFGNDAQEQVLFEMGRAPEILHVATHGFFLKPDERLRKRLLKSMRGTDNHVPPPGDNPMLRAGLAFAGINSNAQFLGDIETTNDGVLTALEVLDLNLSGTKLVVLSACETGLGEIHEGEGVYGLRRSFQEAGVAEVISSLWEVSDAGTQALMTDFYDRMLNGMPAREAMRETQLEMIEDPQWGYPYIWSAFMIVGSYESAGFAVN